MATHDWPYELSPDPKPEQEALEHFVRLVTQKLMPPLLDVAALV